MNRPQREPHRPQWIRCEHELSLFVLVSVLDFVATYILLHHGGFRESNPLALYFLHHWGPRGMLYFKGVMTGVVCVISQIVAVHKPETAQRLLQFGTLVVACVVIYSIGLLLQQRGYLTLTL